MDEDSIFSHFDLLHELIQLIYQGSHRFVLLSQVDDSGWTIHLGLSGHGRWWSGKWTTETVMKIAGSKSSAKLFENFAQRLADSITSGDICIGNWSPDAGADINLTLGPSAKKPLVVPLSEMTSKEAATFATSVFIDLALEAQSRKCKLNPPFTLSSFEQIVSSKKRVATPEPLNKRSSSGVYASPIQAAQEEIKSLKAQIETDHKMLAKRKGSPSPEPHSIPKRAPRPKGASLANPNKKARKYQAIEFASDDEC